MHCVAVLVGNGYILTYKDTRACGHKWVVQIFEMIFRHFEEAIFDIAQRQGKNCRRRNAENSAEKMCNSFMSTRPSTTNYITAIDEITEILKPSSSPLIESGEDDGFFSLR